MSHDIKICIFIFICQFSLEDMLIPEFNVISIYFRGSLTVNMFFLIIIVIPKIHGKINTFVVNIK